MNRKSILAAVLATTLAATMSVTATAAGQSDNSDVNEHERQFMCSSTRSQSEQIEAMSKWLDGLTVTPSSNTPAGLAPAEMTDDELTAYTDKIFEMVNKEREKAGAEPLARSDYLNDAANTRAQDCASMGSIRYNGQPHTRPDGSRWFTVLGIEKNSNYGENAGEGKFTAEAQMKSWMASEGHRANILKENYTEIGIGCAISEQGEIFTIQIFYRP